MLLTLFACISTALCVYCVLKRVNQRSIELAVHAAMHEVKKEFQERNATMVSQLATKERELQKARELVKLHESVPTPASPPVRSTATAAAPPAAAKGKQHPEGLDVFQMSRPFTDTSYDALMAVTDVVRVEPASI